MRYGITTILLLMFCHLMTISASNNTEVPHYKVATKNVEPFVSCDKSTGTCEGFSIDFLEMALRGRATFNFTVFQSNREIFNAVNSEGYDFGHAAITKTVTRETLYDFSHSFFFTGFRILVKKSVDAAATSSNFVNLFFTSFFWRMIGVGFFIITVYMNMIWFAEYMFSKDRFLFHTNYFVGIKSAFWWVIQALLQQKTEDPKNVVSKTAATFIRASAVIMISFFTAAATINMNDARFIGEINGIDDLPGHSVGTVNGSVSYDYLKPKQQLMDVTVYQSVDDMKTAIMTDQVEAVLYDEPVLIQFIIDDIKANTHTDLTLVGDLFEDQSYGMMFRQSIESRVLKETINQYILDALDNPEFDDIYNKWFRFNEELSTTTGTNFEISSSLALISFISVILLFAILVFIYCIRKKVIESRVGDKKFINDEIDAQSPGKHRWNSMLSDLETEMNEDLYLTNGRIPYTDHLILRDLQKKLIFLIRRAEGSISHRGLSPHSDDKEIGIERTTSAYADLEKNIVAAAQNREHSRE